LELTENLVIIAGVTIGIAIVLVSILYITIIATAILELSFVY